MSRGQRTTPTCRYCGEPIAFVRMRDDSWLPVERETHLAIVKDGDGRAYFTTGWTVHTPRCAGSPTPRAESG